MSPIMTNIHDVLLKFRVYSLLLDKLKALKLLVDIVNFNYIFKIIIQKSF
jgi:hypothetical protein